MEFTHWRVDHDVNGEQWATFHAAEPPAMPRMPGEPERKVVKVINVYVVGQWLEVKYRGKWRPGIVKNWILRPTPMAYVEYWKTLSGDLASAPFGAVDMRPLGDPAIVVPNEKVGG